MHLLRTLAIALFLALAIAPFAQAETTRAPARGLAVVALDGATDAAWALAREVYANPQLRPRALDDARARVLAGEAPAADAPADVRDVSQLRAGVKGDDAASRQLLGAIATQLGARGVLVVEAKPSEKPSARVYLADSGTFDAARYAPDDSPLLAWTGAVQSLARAFGNALPPQPSASAAPSAALHEGPRIENAPPASKKFYESAWFWGAIGAAVFAGGAVYFATRDNSASTIHLQMQAPK